MSHHARRVLAFLTITLFSAALFAADEKPASPDDVQVLRDLEYAKVGDISLKLDLYLPRNANGKLPVIVAVHGGGWETGDKAKVPVVDLAKDGFAVASINYRLSRQAIFPAQIEDCKAAIRWLRAHSDEYHLDPDHFGAWGDSAGGHLVALLGVTGGNKDLEGDEGNLNQSSAVQAVCDWYGPTDLTTMAHQKGGAAEAKLNSAASPESRMIGGPVGTEPEKARRASPITYVSSNAPPFLIMHGDKDTTVPMAQSEELRDALQKAGVPVELVVIHGVGHGFPRDPALLERVRNFFADHLNPPKADLAPDTRKQIHPSASEMLRQGQP